MKTEVLLSDLGALAFPQEQIAQLAQDAVKKSWTVRDLERMAKAINRKPRKNAQADTITRRNTYLDEVELALNAELGRRVKVTGNENGGTLEIAFYNLDDLRDLAERLAREG